MDWMDEEPQGQTQAEWYRAGERYQAIIAAETDGHSCGGWILTDFDTWTRCLVCPDAGHPEAVDDTEVFDYAGDNVAGYPDIDPRNGLPANEDMGDGIPF